MLQIWILYILASRIRVAKNQPKSWKIPTKSSQNDINIIFYFKNCFGRFAKLIFSTIICSIGYFKNYIFSDPRLQRQDAAGVGRREGGQGSRRQQGEHDLPRHSHRNTNPRRLLGSYWVTS